ncbi:hypothetical protein [Streptomyces sp. NPDC006739]|uniref:hypothetical protein n=1 Tax=Streptomyces sp. NPDC006739 TaxID=3364763 RepID=UPI00369173D8
MSQRHPLATPGAWVELRDPSELRYGDKQAVQSGIADVENKGALGVNLNTSLISLLVVNWEIPGQMLPLPSQDPSVIGMLTIADGNALEKLITPARELLFPGDPESATAEEQTAAAADPASPTAPTAGSSQP